MPIANIGEGYIEYTDTMKTYFFNIKSYIDSEWVNDYQIEQNINKIIYQLTEISDLYVITLTIIGKDNSELLQYKLSYLLILIHKIIKKNIEY